MWLLATLVSLSQLLFEAAENWDLTILYHSARKRSLHPYTDSYSSGLHLSSGQALWDCLFVFFASFIASVSEMSFGDVKRAWIFLTVNHQLPPLSHFYRALQPLSNRSELLEDTIHDFFGLESPEPATYPGPRTVLANVCSALWVCQRLLLPGTPFLRSSTFYLCSCEGKFLVVVSAIANVWRMEKN